VIRRHPQQAAVQRRQLAHCQPAPARTTSKFNPTRPKPVADLSGVVAPAMRPPLALRLPVDPDRSGAGGQPRPRRRPWFVNADADADAVTVISSERLARRSFALEDLSLRLKLRADL
jgi:hypothetical protein